MLQKIEEMVVFKQNVQNYGIRELKSDLKMGINLSDKSGLVVYTMEVGRLVAQMSIGVENVPVVLISISLCSENVSGVDSNGVSLESQTILEEFDLVDVTNKVIKNDLTTKDVEKMLFDSLFDYFYDYVETDTIKDDSDLFVE